MSCRYQPNSVPAERAHASWNHAQDTGAFEALFREARDGLLNFLLRRLWSREDAEDALMQTFYKAWRARDGFRGETGERQWLYGIAGRVAIDIQRVRRRRPTEPLEREEEVEASCPREADPVDILIESERRAHLHRVIDRLTPDQRRLVQLFYFHGWKYAEISSVLGIPQTQVKGRLHRIRRRIEQELIAPAEAADRLVA